MNKMKRLYYKFRVQYWYEIQETFRKNCFLKIPARKPEQVICPNCKKPMKIRACDTGEGWAFDWGCDDFHDEILLDEWYPFMFGVWCNTKDLERIGIEVW